MTHASKTKAHGLNRRDALKRLGLAVGAVYMTPVVLSLSTAHASDGGSGGGGSGGGGSGGGGSGGSGGGGNSGGSGGVSSVSTGASLASAPSSSLDDDDQFSGDSTPAGGNLSADEELRLIQNGWQKAGG